MYGKVSAGSGAGLAFMGEALSIPWLLIAGLTMLSVGIALVRLFPKREV